MVAMDVQGAFLLWVESERENANGHANRPIIEPRPLAA
jgi:hypothetical protein